LKFTGSITLRMTALEPIHHGAGTTAGNTQIQRTQRIIKDDGNEEHVPFVSGASLKHMLRVSAAQYALDVMDIPDKSLVKEIIDILFSGGHLSKGGTSMDLTIARDLERLFPALSLCGYSAGNQMTESKIAVSHVHVVCAENAWRLPDDLRDHPHSLKRAGAVRSDEFGTRHDQATSAQGERYMIPGSEAVAPSAQMIYDFETILPGAVLFADVRYTNVSAHELAALMSAFHYCAVETRESSFVMVLGAKGAVGFGRVDVKLSCHERIPPVVHVKQPRVGAADPAGKAYIAHLTEHRKDILALLDKAV
jgi:hypothetical protein